MGWGFSILCLIGGTAAIVWYVYRKRHMKLKSKHANEMRELQELHVDNPKERTICSCKTNTCVCGAGRENWHDCK